jgi:signal transduction histidine kinase
MVIAMTSANYTVGPQFLSRFLHTLFLLAFCLTPIFFMHFISNFIPWTNKTYRFVLLMFYLIGIILAGFLSYSYWLALRNLSLESIQDYISIYNFIFRPFLLLSIIGITSVLIFSFIIAKDAITKKKLKWLLFGFLIGPLAFAILWAFPLLFLGYPLMPEYLMNLLLISFPVSIAIAIVKYQMMDIDFLINRSVVYTIVISGLAATYILLFTLFTLLIKGMEETFPAVISAVIVAVFMNPIKIRVQKIVDKKFFRVEYNYREEQKRFLVDIKNSNDIKSLADKIVTHADALIPVSKIGFFIVYVDVDTDYVSKHYNSEGQLRKPGYRVSILAHKGFEILVGRSLKFDEENLKTDLAIPVALDDKVEPGVVIESADLKVFKRWGMALVFPIKSPSGIFHAFLVLGTKKSGVRYYQEDIDLLNTVAATSALTIERIKLQEELIREQLESERLEELNKLKSYFVSSVSHELKTPLTSIKMFAELLKETSTSEKSQEYLKIINGESDRLRRLIDNVLDFAKIEKGLQTYDMSLTDINQLAIEVLKMMEYQFRMSKIELVENISKEKYIINADKGAVEEAMINILSNAIKYSDQNTKIIVSTYIGNGFIIYKVEDEGIGISQKDLNEIFNPFFRSQSNGNIKAEGAGLGLTIIKHIIDAHKGKIIVESTLGKGSSFTLQFPNESSNKT